MTKTKLMNKFQEKAYKALLSVESATAKYLSDRTRIHYGKVYEIIDQLSSMGFCRSTIDNPRRFEAINPNLGMDVFKTDILKDIEKQRQDLIKIYNKHNNNKSIVPEKQTVQLLLNEWEKDIVS